MFELKSRLTTLLMLLTLLFAAPAVAASMEGPVELLSRVSDQVIKVLKDEREQLETDPDRIYQIVNNYIIPHLDDVTMAKLALGKNWRNASNEQKIEFVDQFRILMVRTYSKSLQEFSDQKIRFFPMRVDDNEDRVMVKSEVLQSGGPTIPVSYRMRIKDNAWKVYDINIDGVSLVTSYRGTFAQEMRKGGMEGLLKMLQDKNSKVTEDSVTPETTTTNTSQTAS